MNFNPNQAPTDFTAQVYWTVEMCLYLNRRLNGLNGSGGGSVVLPDTQIGFGTDSGITSSTDFTYNETAGFNVGFSGVTTFQTLINNKGSIVISSGDINGSANGNGISINDNNQLTSVGNVFVGLGNGTLITVNDKNQLITITNVPTFASDSAAVTGGLDTGQLYKNTLLGVTSLCIIP